MRCLLERSNDSFQHLSCDPCCVGFVWNAEKGGRQSLWDIPGPKATVVMLILCGSASKIVQYSSCAPSAVIPKVCFRIRKKWLFAVTVREELCADKPEKLRFSMPSAMSVLVRIASASKVHCSGLSAGRSSIPSSACPLSVSELCLFGKSHVNVFRWCV